eukprot:Em0020g860a
MASPALMANISAAPSSIDDEMPYPTKIASLHQKLYYAFVMTGRDGPLQQSRYLLLHLSSRSITPGAGLTWEETKGPPSEQQGQFTAPDATTHSWRHLVHTSAPHCSSSGCERMLEHTAHFSSFSINWLFTLAKGGLETHVSVKAHINGFLVGLDSTLKYSNAEADPIEVVFRFPLEESFAVVGLEAVIDGRKVKAVIREKEEARQMYDDAIASGHSAALAEEKKGDIFSISLGNLPPRKDAELHLKLAGQLPLDAEGGVRFSLPAVLKPRYTPVGSTDPLAKIEAASHHGSAPAVFSFHLEVASRGVSDVTSPTHQLSKETRGGVIKASINEGQPLDKDLVVVVQYKSPYEPKAIVENGEKGADKESMMSGPVVMLNFFPQFKSSKAACEFIFLVDRSGSMDGEFIRSARETLILFLKSIPPGCSFNIIGFGSNYESLFPSSVPYNQENLDRAIQHAECVEADLGGTELFPPLQFIFGQRLLEGLPRQVFVLTDGSVSNTEACIQEVKRNVESARCFTFGIGSGVSTYLVNGLAQAGNGTAEFIQSGERLQPKVIRSLKQALQPSVTNLRVEFQLPAGFEVTQAPSKAPVLFSGDKAVVYGILKGPSELMSPVDCTASLKGQILDQPLEYSIPFEVPGNSPSFPIPIIHHLAAKALIKDWERDGGNKKSEIVKLSIDEGSHEDMGHYCTDKRIRRMFTILFACISCLRMRCMSYEDDEDCMSFDLMCAAPASSTGKDCNELYCDEKYQMLPISDEMDDMFATKSEMKEDIFFVEKEYNSSMSRSSGGYRGTTDSLSSLISLQQADGSWKLDDVIAKVLSKSFKELSDACPVKCDGGVATLWATILCVVYLELKHPSQKDEWELIAMKAELWLDGQSLPAGADLNAMKAVAKKLMV